MDLLCLALVMEKETLASLFQNRPELPSFLFFLILKIILFIYFWLCRIFIAECRLLSRCSRQGLLSSCNVWASHCSGFFC